ncbi:MAG: hypothetical protein A2283_04940 [Lentisphaerae bacterium RIFOXYA12_FULL_48_11]|nr:MAG: hypothetical protein A2283_04940 [Lentisphaerae bacterium RIFOXYA12_FULL_48_11]
MYVRLPLIILALPFLCQIVIASEDDDWLSKHAVVKTSETQDCDDDGSVKAVRTVKVTNVNITQTCTEVKQKNAQGILELTSRTTETLDTLGGKATIIEGQVKGYAGLIVTSITTIQKTPSGTITTTQTRSASGSMRIVYRVTVNTDPMDGITSTIVEALDKQGRLVTKQTIMQN